MDAGGAGELGDALDGGFHVARRDHHEVGELVDDHEQVRVGVQGPVEAGLGLHLSGGHRLVEVVDVLEAVVRQVVVARVHLLDDPFEGLGGLLGVGDDRRDEVRDALVDREFHALGVNEDHAHLLGRRTHHDRGDHGVDEGGLAGAGLACHEHVRGLRQVSDDVAALDVLADADDERVLVTAGGCGAQDVAEGHVFAVGVGDLDADGALTGNRREDTHVGGGHGVGDVFRQVRELVDLDAGAEDDLVAGDCRTARESRDARVDVEVREDLAQCRDDLIVDGRARHVGRAGDEEVFRRQGVGDRVVEVGLEGPLGLVGDRRGCRLVLGFRFGFGHVGGNLYGCGSHGGAHLREHLGGRVGRRGTRPGRGRGRLRSDRSRLEKTRFFGRVGIGGLAEGLVAVVFVEEGVVSCGEVLAGLAASFLGRVLRVLFCGLSLSLGALATEMCSEVAKARRHIRDSRAGGQQDRVREEQKQEGASTPAGQE